MKEKNKFVTEAKLIVLMARHIKQSKRELKGVEILNLFFGIEQFSDSICVIFGDGEYRIKSTMENLFNIARKALDVSGGGWMSERWCKEGHFIEMIIFGKPTNSFCVLARTLERQASVKIGWDDIRTETENGNPFLTTYLCHNEERCKDALSFIRSKASRDNLQVSVYPRFQNDCGVMEHVLRIEITTPKGKIKATKEFYAEMEHSSHKHLNI